MMDETPALNSQQLNSQQLNSRPLISQPLRVQHQVLAHPLPPLPLQSRSAAKERSRLAADLLRIAATCGVLLIHGLDVWHTLPTTGLPRTLGEWVLVGVDQSCRFSVSLFVLLSGYALAKRYGQATEPVSAMGNPPAPPFSWREFWARRGTRIGVPFLFWSVISLVVMTIADMTTWNKPWEVALLDAIQGDPQDSIVWRVVRLIAIGAADYQLYFLPIIVMCYLFYPLVRRLPLRPGPVIVTVVLLFAWTAYQQASRWWSVPFPQVWTTFPLPWVPLFTIGTFIALAEKSLRVQVHAWPGWVVRLLVVSGPAACFIDWCLSVAIGVPTEDAGDSSRPWAPWSAFMVMLAAVRWGEAVAVRLGRWTPIVTAFAAASFATFLSHTWVMRGCDAIGLRAGGTVMYAAGAFTASWLVGLALFKLGGRWRWVGWAIGR